MLRHPSRTEGSSCVKDADDDDLSWVTGGEYSAPMAANGFNRHGHGAAHGGAKRSVMLPVLDHVRRLSVGAMVVVCVLMLMSRGRQEHSSRQDWMHAVFRAAAVSSLCVWVLQFSWWVRGHATSSMAVARMLVLLLAASVAAVLLRHCYVRLNGDVAGILVLNDGVRSGSLVERYAADAGAWLRGSWAAVRGQREDRTRQRGSREREIARSATARVCVLVYTCTFTFAGNHTLSLSVALFGAHKHAHIAGPAWQASTLTPPLPIPPTSTRRDTHSARRSSRNAGRTGRGWNRAQRAVSPSTRLCRTN